MQKDKELIKALGLNLKHVTAGAEPAQVARWSQAYKQQKPVLFYWYTPQYLNPAVRPGRGASCRRAPRRTRTARTTRRRAATPSSTSARTTSRSINKLFSKKFADSGSPAYDMLKKMTLDERGPGARSRRRSPATSRIPRRPAPDWVKDNEAKVQEWLQ